MGTPVVEAVHGDITAQDVDAVVNAANRHLRGGGGVDGAIHRAAGAGALRQACIALGGVCEPGDAVATPGFKLRAPWIIHTVGPVWSNGARGEPATLASCYRRCLEVADRIGAKSMAFPAISTGVYGYPPELAADVAVSAVGATDTDVELVRLVAFDGATYDLYIARLRET